MNFLVPVWTLVLLSSFPVARANLDCNFTIDNTDICDWTNNHTGLAIAAVGGVVALMVFLAFLVNSYRFRNVARRSPGSMSFAPNDPPPVSAQLPPQHPPLYSEQLYPFPGHGSMNQNGPLPNPYATYAPPQGRSPAVPV
ncbi:hypothetical protein PAXINDRAFT_172768 [Paxillus involutus ATCC 200175]|uniref:Uncharacterized protein n=1 Tax=Paxillus involutus ATCC 200175 TaxID=664439 RepID=A0A0C9SZP2_PAXIN|nr:hypothetical protein PAXINDRAFT_172768 [Paxillus involutus ATCC 200175]